MLHSLVRCNCLLINFETTKLRSSLQFQEVAEEILTHLRDFPPAAGFGRVEIPGERERLHRLRCNGKLAVPERNWQQILREYEKPEIDPAVEEELQAYMAKRKETDKDRRCLVLV